MKNDITNCVLQSNGKYEPEHWYHVLIQKKVGHYVSFDVNNFNVGSISIDDLDGYKIVPYSKIYGSKEAYEEDLFDGKERWLQ